MIPPVQVKLAYENVKEVDCLDTTKDGNEQWEDAMKRYEQRIDQVHSTHSAHHALLITQNQSMIIHFLN